MRTRWAVVSYAVLLAVVLGSASCQRGSQAPSSTGTATPPSAASDPRTLGLFEPLPTQVQADPARVALGHRLYHDPALSADGTLSCASCHDIANGGDDGRPTSVGINGQLGPINAPTVLNASYNLAQFWDGRAANLQEQAAGPVANPREMGATWDQVVSRLSADQSYADAFHAIYPDGITEANATDAIAEFERTLVTPNSRFDRYLQGDDNALTADERQGFELFVSVGCHACHNGAAIGGRSFQRFGNVHDYFADRGHLTDADNGRYNVTHNEADRHVFKVPLLRNVALTAPYFHDASGETLEQAVRVMAHYQLGRELTDEQVAKLAAFLRTLTGDIPST